MVIPLVVVTAVLDYTTPFVDSSGHAGGALGGFVAAWLLIREPRLLDLHKQNRAGTRVAALVVIALFATGTAIVLFRAARLVSRNPLAVYVDQLDSESAPPWLRSGAAWMLATDETTPLPLLARSASVLERVTRATPSAAIRDTLAMVYYRQGAFERAVEVERQLVATQADLVYRSQLARFELALSSAGGASVYGDCALAVPSLRVANSLLSAETDTRCGLPVRIHAALVDGGGRSGLASTAMPGQPLVILNPASRGGATGRQWKKVEARLRGVLGDVEVALTRGPRDAERIAREAVRSGVERLIVAGGDGTTSEVASGLLDADLAKYAQIASLPLGTGGDLARTLGIPRDLDAAMQLIRDGATRCIDAGRLEYRDRGGAERSAYFVNVASFGISGLVDELVNRAPKWLGGGASFAIGTLRGIARYRPARVALRVDGELLHDGPLVLAAAANGRFFGGGMQVAPDASPDDGAFDVVVVEGASKARLVSQFPSLYRGSHVSKPGVKVVRGKTLEAEAEPGTVWLDVDGEALGTLPARFVLLPEALTWFGVPKGGPA
jgi:YegS/Rv2252/BmrU family lipid kinase